MSLSSKQPSIGNTDQAEGLRNLFGNNLPKVFFLSSALDPDSTAAIGLGVAHALRRSGFKVLLVDEVSFHNRQRLNSQIYSTKYDLGQALSNLVSFEKAVMQVEDNLWFTTASRARHYFASKQLVRPALDVRTQEFGLGLDYIVVVSDDPAPAVMPYLSANLNHIVLASCSKSNQAKTIALINQLMISGADEPVSIMMVGGNDRNEGDEAFRALAQEASAQLDTSLALLHWVGAKSLSDFNDEASTPAQAQIEPVIPASLFRHIAHQISS
ncbi:hypothetical protein [Polynucleobacter sp. AP-Kolm-20A-A1]|uniref:hypothetical protein n=1 Tax=Polynucleobacter sp. AP-Kolm-20A-A1 TaxID=2081041 RepID=UPI001BFD1867|nr:hypothetical protein [Polynucleobacter sp. AP-Kolm-20A-A1]QWE19960.1 hypothetical protein C2745_06010 [Polynucleobacter sp. AP-Kolm-20A-A1]